MIYVTQSDEQFSYAPGLTSPSRTSSRDNQNAVNTLTENQYFWCIFYLPSQTFLSQPPRCATLPANQAKIKCVPAGNTNHRKNNVKIMHRKETRIIYS